MKPRTGPALILNVDDDEPARYATSRQLRKAGFETIEAATGEEALRLAAAHRPDLVLLDIRLPDIDGFEVCRRLRAHPEIATTPVLQMSASYLDMSSRVKGLENGADGYLTEPVEPAVLMATINSLLRMKRAERQVAMAARQWQATFEAVADGIAFLDLNGNVLQSNSAWAGIAGSDPHRVNSSVTAMVERFRVTGEQGAVEETFGDRTVSMTIDGVVDDQRELSAVVCTLRDVTARKRFEEQLRQSQKLESIGVLAGGIAHDFNNLLTGVLGNASLLLEILPPAEPVHDIASEIVKAGESAALLTKQILAYSGKGAVVMRPLNLSLAVMDSLPLVRRFIPKNVELVCDTDADLPAINADPSQIQQVIMNLIINAAESFEGKAGSIRVGTSREDLKREDLTDDVFRPGEPPRTPGAYALLTVADTGGGMDAATQNRIFEPFFTTKFTGRGLGLSAVHGIVTGHGAILRLWSAPGRGTTFKIFFPALKEPAPSVSREEKHLQKGSGTILVIDDEPTVRNFTRLALESLGYRVETASDGESGIDVFRRSHAHISLVLLDLTMPVMSGEQVIQHIHSIASSVPVILSSGFSEAVAAERFKGRNMAGFLAKPYTVSELSECVRKVIAMRNNSIHRVS